MAQVTKPARTHLTRQAQPVRIPGLIILLYAVAAYLVFLGVLGYAVGFFAGFGVPKAIDQGPRAGVPLAAAIDLLLLLLFAVQHTVMARPWFKRRWSRFLPPPAERATFVLAASLLLALLFWQWRPIGVKIWSLSAGREYRSSCRTRRRDRSEAEQDRDRGLLSTVCGRWPL